ncbi:hypothetical protein N9B24_00855 [bacterium]|nr:hypothetical protein [bacterium]
MRPLNITASNSADISFPEIDPAGLTAQQQHELAMLKIEHAKRDRRERGELEGNVHAMAAGLMLDAGIPDNQVAAAFVAEGHERDDAEKLVDIAAAGPKMTLHTLTSDICRSLGASLGVRESRLDAWATAADHSKRKMPHVMAAATNLVSLSSVLVQTANRVLLLPAQDQQPASIQMCRPYSVPDFRRQTILKPIQPNLTELGSTGEIKAESPPMTVNELPNEPFKLTTFGYTAGFGRHEIINDTAIEFIKESVTAARYAAYNALDREFFKMLASLTSGTAGTYWLTADSEDDKRRANAFTATSGSGFDLAFYNQLATTLRKQVNQNDTQSVKSQRASVLLVPAEMEVSARAVLKEVFSGMLASEIPRLVVSDWLTHSAVTNDPATAAKTAYLITDRDAGAFCCAYLNGEENPIVSLQDMNLNDWAWHFKVIFDFKHLAGDPTCAVKGITA